MASYFDNNNYGKKNKNHRQQTDYSAQGGALGTISPVNPNNPTLGSYNSAVTTSPVDSNTSPYSQYYKAALDEIKNKYSSARNNLSEQQAGIPAQYTQQRNLASQQANQSARQLAELRAQQGYSRSPRLTNGVASIYGARDSAIGQANLGEQQARQSYTNRMNELNNEEATALQSMYGKQALDERNFAQQDYSNRLNMMNALLNYNLGVGQVTDTLPQVKGFNYGDTLKSLLSQLYGSGTSTGTSEATTVPNTKPAFGTPEYKAWLKANLYPF